MTHTITDEQLKKVKEVLDESFKCQIEGGRVNLIALRAVLSILNTIEKQPESAWQPIETAPRDGTEFIAIIKGVESGDMRIVSPCRYNQYGEFQFDYSEISYSWVETHWMQIDQPITPAQQAEAELIEGMHTA